MHQKCILILISVLVICQIAKLLAASTNEELIKQLTNCSDREHVFKKILHSKYWVLVNYVRAEHETKILCASSITYTTHGDYRYLDNVAPLVERWRAPISLALYAPGSDFNATVRSILWLRQCDPKRQLIQKWVSFHMYFPVEHIPKVVLSAQRLLRLKVKCSKIAPFDSSQHRELYRKIKNLDYHVNVGRNIAKKAALTHFVLASDIELYPSPGLVNGFLQMLGQNLHLLQHKNPIVYPLNIFEVPEGAIVPSNKLELKYQMALGQVIPFHLYVCPDCHKGPGFNEWINYFDTSNDISVFNAYNYTAPWEPIYIGSIHDPAYDERLSWEGMSDKRTQAVALCLMNYEFHTLDNAFLVHKPGIKKGFNDMNRKLLAFETTRIIHSVVYKELITKYGFRAICRFV